MVAGSADCGASNASSGGSCHGHQTCCGIETCDLSSGHDGRAFGLIIALCFMLFGAALSGLGGKAAGFAGVMGIAALIFLPIMYGVIGFIAGAIGGAMYNLVAGVVGGIEIEVE
jgi:hypothetical protein